MEGLTPGTVCPTCKRRINHPKKASSPDTLVFSYRVPVDEAEAHREIRETTARFLGTHERPHWQFHTFTLALALVLQDESMRGMGQRSPVA